MRFIYLTVIITTLLGCSEDGYKGLPPLVNGMSAGDGINFVKEESDNWDYETVEKDGKVISSSAVVYALNTYKSPIYEINQRPFIKVIKKDYKDNEKDVQIFASETLKCTPTCEISIDFGDEDKVYTMVSLTDSVIVPLSNSDKIYLFNKFTHSEKAIVWLPIVGLASTFGAEFDLTGFDAKKMVLGAKNSTADDSSTIGNSGVSENSSTTNSRMICADFSSQADAQAYFNINRELHKNLDGDGDGKVCESYNY